MHSVETSDSCLVDRSFRTSCDDDVSLTHTDIVERIDHRISGRSTRRNSREVRPTQSMTHRNVSRCNIYKHLRDEERIETRSTITFGKRSYLISESSQTSNTRTPNDTYTISV